MTYTRLTIVGRDRRADIVVPDDEPFSALLPDVLDLLGEAGHFEGAPVRLIRRTGGQIELAATPAELAVPHGEVLRVVRAEDAPPPPEVADVTDVVAESLEQRRDRWNAAAREWTGAAVVAASTTLLGLAGVGVLGDAAIGVLAAVWAVGLLAAVVFGRLRFEWTRLWTTALAVGVSLPLAQALSRVVSEADAADPALLIAAILGWAAVGLGLGVAARSAAPAWAGLTGVLGAGVWLALAYTPLPAPAVPALVGIAALVAIGILPSLALSASGLSRLDDAGIAGTLPSRRAVANSLDEAYAALAWVGVSLALLAGAAGAVLATSPDTYALLLAVAIGVVLALRTRQFPLTVHVVPLWVAAVVVIVAVAASPLLPPGAGAAIMGTIGLATVVLVGVRPAPHVRVRIRRAGNLLELVAVVATVPLLLGTLAVYPDLLQVFP